MPRSSALVCATCAAPCRKDDRFCSQCGRRDPTAASKTTRVPRVDADAITEIATRSGVLSSTGVDDAPLPPGTTFARRYRIERVLGEGGMGRVYKATDMAMDEAIAIKVLSFSFSSNHGMLEQFKRELKLARRIRHRNVVASFHLGESQGRSYITQEYIDAENLSMLVERRGPLSLAETLGLVRQVLRGLKAAHELEIVHRDIKASNILVNKEGMAFVTDFGLATSVAQTGVSDLAGTPQYMAPELFSGGSATPSSDFYALGVLLYFLLTGRFPFPGKQLSDLYNAHAKLAPKTIPPRLPVSPPIHKLYERMLAKDPTERPHQAGELLEVIEDVLAVDALAMKSGRPIALVADRDPQVRSSAREVLGSEGYEIEEVDTASQAVNLAFSHDPALVVLDSDVEGGQEIAISREISVAFADEILPRHGGLKFCRLLQNDPRLRRVPILVITSQRHPGLKPAFTLMGAAEVISKPFTREEFAAGAQRARGAALARAEET
ncbi:MAG: protein kinase domain-containing protein [Candidatus Eiseniibacteriota bacterium]